MSSATVRAAIKAYLLGKQNDVPGMNKIYGASPYWADGSEWDLAASLGSGAVVAVHLDREQETRITLPALTGSKAVRYVVGLLIYYQWLIPSAQFTATEDDAWAGPLDDIIDGLKAVLRADPNLGDALTVFQAAQGELGQNDPDLTISRGIPRRSEGKVLSWAVLEFHATEIITA